MTTAGLDSGLETRSSQLFASLHRLREGVEGAKDAARAESDCVL